MSQDRIKTEIRYKIQNICNNCDKYKHDMTWISGFFWTTRQYGEFNWLTRVTTRENKNSKRDCLIIKF